MRFRFLKGEWEFGKYKLQFQQTHSNEWEDVPTVELPTLDEMQGCLKGKMEEPPWEDVPTVEVPTLDQMQGCLKGKTENPPMEEKMEWCTHFRWDDERKQWYTWFVSVFGSSEKKYLEDKIKFCAWCGAHQPKERKKLWMKLHEINRGGYSNCSEEYFQALAKAAIQAFREMIDRNELTGGPPNEFRRGWNECLNDLKKCLKEK